MAFRSVNTGSKRAASGRAVIRKKKGRTTMDKPVTFAICGLGIRGLEAYAAFQKQHPEK